MARWYDLGSVLCEIRYQGYDMMYALKVYSLGGGWYAKLNVYGDIHILPQGRTCWLPCRLPVRCLKGYQLVAKGVLFK